jgi:hypothetical protein
MGKRSDFKRIARDSYDTPISAVAPLLPWLTPQTRYIEPCAGAGRLIEHLSLAGHVLISAHDLPDDARSNHYNVPAGAVFVTNPPFWGRSHDLHPIVVNLSDQAPTWLLMPADWLHNVSSAPLMPRLRMIVSIGRVRWIPDSEFTGKDNCIWALFGPPSSRAATRFIGRQAR